MLLKHPSQFKFLKVEPYIGDHIIIIFMPDFVIQTIKTFHSLSEVTIF